MVSSNVHIVMPSAYSFYCIDCGKPLKVNGDVEATDMLRRKGVCDDCLENRLSKIMKRLAPPPWPLMPKEVWRN